ncbi:hypothetical protein BJY21_000381 [Kineosphaera limosa]|uniref:Uncharacterized protein n=1 Tax=Kineosphaera limosa NBRC 100340 TaxID=1184609 RepID=K6WAW9_9MICO|nr:hypothetical protein [Kineosphaera limosa]NYD99196.1 hypothetical protein [Kineosphaera limosa]GAB96360.1 hypothetical protein KILIM_035_00490 [Kineosphaera limosa NBRC 100340]
MSVNSPVAGLREASSLAAAVTATATRPGRELAPTRVATRAERRPGAHRDPAGTFWRTTMHEFVFFVTFGAVRPWRGTRATVRT